LTAQFSDTAVHVFHSCPILLLLLRWIEIAVGDARLSLEAEAARGDLQKFDVLFVDAFNGESIPVHLLTKEAMALYLAHLRGPGSVIAVHITNRAIDLARS